jgi:multiple sugar transport system ATP-binding protein
MRVEIKKLHQKIKTTIIYVTHDQVEAMTLADRIVIMRDGNIEQQGTPTQLFERPVNTFVATFIGSPPMNLLLGRVGENILEFSEGLTLPIPEDFKNIVKPGQEIILGFRADHIMPVGHDLIIDGALATIEMPVGVSEPLGTETLLYTQLAGQEILAKMLKPRIVKDGEILTFNLDLGQCNLFDATTQKNLR